MAKTRRMCCLTEERQELIRPESGGLHDQQLLHLDEWVDTGISSGSGALSTSKQKEKKQNKMELRQKLLT